MADMDIDEVPPEEQDAGAATDPKATGGVLAVRSIEGWIVLVTNVHEEASEEDLQERFADYGDIQNMHLNLDRRTGYVKVRQSPVCSRGPASDARFVFNGQGYALIEYSTLPEARQAIAQAHNTKLLDQTIQCDFAFVRPPLIQSGGRGGGGPGSRGRGGRGGGGRPRSRSPGVADRNAGEDEPAPNAPKPANRGS